MLLLANAVMLVIGSIGIRLWGAPASANHTPAKVISHPPTVVHKPTNHSFDFPLLLSSRASDLHQRSVLQKIPNPGKLHLLLNSRTEAGSRRLDDTHTTPDSILDDRDVIDLRLPIASLVFPLLLIDLVDDPTPIDGFSPPTTRDDNNHLASTPRRPRL